MGRDLRVASPSNCRFATACRFRAHPKKVNDGRKPALVRGKVIDAFINAGTDAFIKHQDDFLNGTVEGDLISLCDPKVMIAVQAAKDLAKNEIFNHSRRVR